jgi:N-acetylglutamate synthase-like GNAT family acetyltransferase
METFDLAGADLAASKGRLDEWLITLLQREPGANRSLAAIIKGQRPILHAPARVPLDSLQALAGPDPSFRYPKDPSIWADEIAAMVTAPLVEMPPLLIRETNGERHLSDGSHRVDAWRRRGESHGWAIIWQDRDPRFAGWWAPFLPEETPEIGLVESAGEFLPLVEKNGLVMAAKLGERVVGAVRLVPEFGALTLRTLRVDPEFRGLRLGARILNHLRPHMDGQIVHCLAYPWLERFYGEFGLRPVDPAELPEGLRERHESYQDDRGCLALRKVP